MTDIQQDNKLDIQELTFADDLWDKFDLLSKISLEKRKHCEDLIAIIEESTNAQELYAKTIEKLEVKIATISYKGTLGNAIQTLKISFRNKADLSRNLIKNLRNDVLDILKEMIKNQNNEAKNIVNEGKKLEKDFKKIWDNLEKSKQRYLTLSKESEIANIENECIRYNKEIPSDKKTKISQKWQTSLKDAYESEAQYKARISEYNSFLERYYHGLKKLNICFQKHEEERIEQIKAASFKILLFDLDYLRNYQYDLDRIMKNLDVIDVKKDIQDFINEHRDINKRNFYNRAAFDQYISFYQQSIVETLAKMHDSSKSLERDELALEAFRKQYELLITSPDTLKNKIEFDSFQCDAEQKSSINFAAHFFNNSWNGEPIDNDHLKQFEEKITDNLVMKVFILAFQQYRLSGKFLLTEEGYNNISKIMLIALNECYKMKEVIHTKKLVILSLTFYKIIAIPGPNGQMKEEKIFLQTAIANHPIWKEIEFWDSAIFLSIKDEIYNQKHYKLDQAESDSDFFIRQKNLVFGQLASYGHNMLIFEIDKSEVKSILLKYCKFYNLTESQVKDIMSTLEFASKQSEQIHKLLKYLRESLKQKLKIQEEETLKKTSDNGDKDFENITKSLNTEEHPSNENTKPIQQEKIIFNQKSANDDRIINLHEEIKYDSGITSFSTFDSKTENLDKENKSENVKSINSQEEKKEENDMGEANHDPDLLEINIEKPKKEEKNKVSEKPENFEEVQASSKKGNY